MKNPQEIKGLIKRILHLQPTNTNQPTNQPTNPGVGFLEKPGYIFNTGLVVTGHLSWKKWCWMETLKGLSRGFSKGPQSLQRTPNPSLPMEPECFRPKKAYKTQSEIGYCWWFRNPANQLRLVVYPIIYRNLYIPGGFCGISEPSTVWVEGMTLHPPKTYHPKYRSPQKTLWMSTRVGP